MVNQQDIDPSEPVFGHHSHQQGSHSPDRLAAEEQVQKSERKQAPVHLFQQQTYWGYMVK